MRKLRIVVLTHPDLVPPDDLTGYTEAQINEFKTEYDVVSALQALGHDVTKLGISDELRPIRQTVRETKAHIVFNLLEEFGGEVIFDQNVVSYLEATGIKFTGCDPRGLILGRGKALSKKILAYHRVAVPRFAVFRRGRVVRRSSKLIFPLIVKSLTADASVGISQASIVHDEDKLRERVQFIFDSVQTDAIAEQFIDGRDIYVGVLGNTRLTALTPQELVFRTDAPNPPKIATEKVKHDVAYQKKWGIDVRRARGLSPAVMQRIEQRTRRIYRALSLSGYARIDYRLTPSGELYFLEANPNPDLARYEELANAAADSGLEYEPLIQRIVGLGLSRPSVPGLSL